MLIQKDYFAVYGEMLQRTATPYEAWLETEKEFARRYSCSDPNLVLRRYTTYDSFHASFRRYMQGKRQKTIEVVALPVNEVHYFVTSTSDANQIEK